MFDLNLNIYFRQSLAISAFDFHASVQHPYFQVLILKQTTFTITENDSLRDKRDAYKKSSLQSKQFHGPFARPWDVHVALRDGNETW